MTRSSHLTRLPGSGRFLPCCSAEAIAPIDTEGETEALRSGTGLHSYPTSELETTGGVSVSNRGSPWEAAAYRVLEERRQGCFPLHWVMNSLFPSHFIRYRNWIICSAMGSGSLSAHNLCFQLLSPNGVPRRPMANLALLPHILIVP